jgi:hypothetical protein
MPFSYPGGSGGTGGGTGGSSDTTMYTPIDAEAGKTYFARALPANATAGTFGLTPVTFSQDTEVEALTLRIEWNQSSGQGNTGTRLRFMIYNSDESHPLKKPTTLLADFGSVELEPSDIGGFFGGNVEAQTSQSVILQAGKTYWVGTYTQAIAGGFRTYISGHYGSALEPWASYGWNAADLDWEDCVGGYWFWLSGNIATASLPQDISWMATPTRYSTRTGVKVAN